MYMYSDSAFIGALSKRDRAAMPELVEEFFRSGLDEQEQGIQLYTKVNFLNTTEMFHG